MATTTRVRKPSELDEAERRAQRALSMLMRVLDLTDDELAGRAGFSRTAIQARRKGWTRVRPGDAERLAEAMGVPVRLMWAREPEILRWAADAEPWVARDSNPEPTGSVLPFRRRAPRVRRGALELVA